MDGKRADPLISPKRWQRWLGMVAPLPLYLIIAEGVLRLLDFRPLADVVGRVALVTMMLVVLVGLGYALPSLLLQRSRQRREGSSSQARG